MKRIVAEKNKFYIETYGCQMNVSDSEIVTSILLENGWELTQDIQTADIIFINTCSIRRNAEDRIRNRLRHFRSLKKKNKRLSVGLLGCMADRVKDALMEEEQLLDIIAGPDAYRDLPRLLDEIGHGHRAINTILSTEETYAEIVPVRYGSNGVSAFISIMRGCENYCSYCVVPTTRGIERSRDPLSILNETNDLHVKGYREITLLGQNVNSYLFKGQAAILDFPQLLEQVSFVSQEMRIRFATSHPKDLSEKLLLVMADHPNICRAIHLPVQSGSNRILESMNRKYTRETYLEKIAMIHNVLPGCSVSTDIITGFCGETEEDHQETLSLMEEVSFDSAFTFKYSERPNTMAAGRFPDDVPPETKEQRLRDIIMLQHKLSLRNNRKEIGKVVEVLVEGPSKKSPDYLSGRTSQNKMVVFPDTGNKPNDYVNVRIVNTTSATLIGA